MTIKVALEHITTYDFDRTVNIGAHIVRLRPAPHSRTPIEAYSIRVDPAEHFLNWQQDPFGNFQARLVFPEEAKRLEITVELIADMTVVNPFDFFLEESAESVPFTYESQLETDLLPYLTVPPAGNLLRNWLETMDDHNGIRTIDFLVALNQRLANEINYSIRMEPGVQSPEETLERQLGSCRDSAWLLAVILRHLGLASRFVSGYLVQLVADEKPLDGPSGPTEDFTDLHAWTEVFLPGAGWVGLDPTSGLFVGEGHIPLAATPTPSTAAPIAGLIGECEVTFSFSNSVTRIHEDPRVTRPYSELQWSEVDALGRLVDEHLDAGDVRLTMGGEPTFVAVTKADTPEWNTEADGKEKRRLATELTDRLWARFAKDGVIHHGQGKWYPGEPLPRWQRALVWRTDGEALWRDPSLLAEPSQDGELGSPEAGADAAKDLLSRIGAALGVDTSTMQAAWEDPIHTLWAEAQLPDGEPPEADLDPSGDDLVTGDSRRSLTARLDSGAGVPTGWVLPLHRDPKDRWATSAWSVRRDRLFLTPGDSPMGYRLPIAALGWEPVPPAYEASPFARLRPFPEAPVGSTALDAGSSGPSIRTGSDIPPTALCVQVRSGHPHVFLPPMGDGTEAVELIGAVEAAAGETRTPVVIEGYPIPGDPRLRTLVVAPDPGVIEVNVPPARSWQELKDITLGVAEDARQSRLSAEKFDLDGTHTGTGGGNHITIGGPTAADSPLLRRPALLRSLLTYWQHHPALSYLFSGRFIGPSSQAPRVDEARDDNLYELETSFAELDRLEAEGTPAPPWIVDRLLRHLLVDLTGNTHRSEFCIDKLFSPDSERGRLGLLELRGFEMPPHPEMALVQALLVRTLVARCWDHPYQHDPVRFGTALHDRYLLPWFVEEDIREITRDLHNHQLPFKPEWLAPFMEFRFPRHGTTTVAGVTMEVRGAVEPWHVLGEEATGGGMARYVDSSVERLQLRVDGITPGRHVITCNGITVPLTSTSVPGTSIAGIRFKAWQPPSGLHPTLGIDSPLTFDVYDRWNDRSLGGARYHVVHQGGLSYDSVPVNSSEAESRRQSRFETIGHTPHASSPKALQSLDHREYPVTLDLRRARQ